MEITSVTTEYDQQQDRLCLSIADGQGATARRWLTLRLLTRLLPTLLQQSQKRKQRDTHLFLAPRPRFRYPLPHDTPARRPCFALRQTREQKDTHFL